MEKDNKKIFSYNLREAMRVTGRSRKDISEALNISYHTITDWVKGKKYPRMDKVEMLANYFGVLKSDLIEDPNENTQNNNSNLVMLTEEEDALLSLFRQIPESKQAVVIEMIRLALKTQE